MSQNTRTFWVTFAGTALAVTLAVVGLGAWLWTTGGTNAVLVDRLSRVEIRVGQLENNAQTTRDFLIEIRNDVKWIKQSTPRDSH